MESPASDPGPAVARGNGGSGQPTDSEDRLTTPGARSSQRPWLVVAAAFALVGGALSVTTGGGLIGIPLSLLLLAFVVWQW